MVPGHGEDDEVDHQQVDVQVRPVTERGEVGEQDDDGGELRHRVRGHVLEHRV